MVELGIVLDARDDPRASTFSARLTELLGIEWEPITVQLAEEARRAHRRYGRGSGHLARLNFGDCVSYALARVTGEKLLFKGEAFALTDVPR
ncbi:MAG TPA: type II toxin-antitoxin system VapC family toxin [Micropruina sp.]|nr:type II toxin-antitoxin system VapC family toxin [Micropruina sp.]